MFVIMRADGSSGIDVQGRIGAQFPALGTVAWTVLIIGLGVTVISVLLIAPNTRFRPERTSIPRSRAETVLDE